MRLASDLPSIDRDDRSERRLVWRLTRSVLEADIYKHRRYGEKRRRHWSLFETMIRVFGGLLKTAGLYRKGYRNATNIVVNRLHLHIDGLPEPFHGYTLLHLTDLHLDFIPGIEALVCRCIEGLTYDACMMTGDYRAKTRGSIASIVAPMASVIAAIRAEDGIYATLGNHDTYMMVEPLENMGITVLANETAEISRNGCRMQITGVDDPYYYYTDQALDALERSGDGFKVALVHTPSLFDTAAANGYRLYLCGHTHGGQICLPGGRPVILHLRHGRRYYRGLWRYKAMTGYTSQGCGTVGIPVRFNTQSEITLITLHPR